MRGPPRWGSVGTYFRFVFLLLPILALALLVTWLPRADRSARDLAPVAEARAQAAPSPAALTLDAELGDLAEGFDGTVGMAVYDIAADRMASANGALVLPQQSVSKLWVTMTALDLVDRERLDLLEPVVITRDDLTLFHQPIRDIVRTQGSFRTDYADLIERALTRSDNTANDTILRRVGGPQAVEDFLSRHDVEGVRFGTDERTKQSAIAALEWRQSYSRGNAFFEAREKVPDTLRRVAFEGYLADPVDGATAEGIALAFGRLVRGELLSSLASTYLLDTLEETHSGPNRLKGGLPPGWGIAHKTGTGQFYGGEQSGYNDVGVITSPDGREYGVAVLIGRTRQPTLERMDLMHRVVAALARYDAAEYGSSGVS